MRSSTIEFRQLSGQLTTNFLSFPVLSNEWYRRKENPDFSRRFILVTCMCYNYVWVYAHEYRCPGGQSCWKPLKLELQAVVCQPRWVLGSCQNFGPLFLTIAPNLQLWRTKTVFTPRAGSPGMVDEMPRDQDGS